MKGFYETGDEMNFLPLIKNAKKNRITGTRIYLRILNVSDASRDYCTWINSAQINNYLETKKTTVMDLKKYIKQKKMNPDCLFYGIFLTDTHEHIGNIKLEPLDLEKKTAVLGILIGDTRHWGKGYCKEVISLLANYAFTVLELESIDLGVYLNNVSAIKCYQKAGFSEVQKTDNNGIIMRLHAKKKSGSG